MTETSLHDDDVTPRAMLFRAFVRMVGAPGARLILDESAAALGRGFSGIQVSAEHGEWTVAPLRDRVALRLGDWPLVVVSADEADRIVRQESSE